MGVSSIMKLPWVVVRDKKEWSIFYSRWLQLKEHVTNVAHVQHMEAPNLHEPKIWLLHGWTHRPSGLRSTAKQFNSHSMLDNDEWARSPSWWSTIYMYCRRMKLTLKKFWHLSRMAHTSAFWSKRVRSSAVLWTKRHIHKDLHKSPHATMPCSERIMARETYVLYSMASWWIHSPISNKHLL